MSSAMTLAAWLLPYSSHCVDELMTAVDWHFMPHWQCQQLGELMSRP